MKTFNRFLGILLLGIGSALLVPISANAESPATEVSFPLVWERIQKNAPSERVSEFQLLASVIEKERDLRQWYPRIYFDARALLINDPALSFFSVLNQRQIHSSDFAPDLLNYPGYQFYQKGTLGLEWPFYDGGARDSRLASQEKTVLAKDYEQKRGTIELYAESASLYGSAMILEEEANQLKKLLESTENLIGKYRIGVKSNPLGYSGLLGLKTLKNRINEALIKNSSRLNSEKNGLKEKALSLPSNWKPRYVQDGENILSFVHQFLAPADDKKETAFSAQTLALEAESQASEKLIEAEKAKERPHIGLFSEASLNNGNRDIASAYVLGVYLQWDLYSMENYRKTDQATASALALKAKSDDIRLQEKIEHENTLDTLSALEKRIDLLTDSSKLLAEQSKTAKKLFLNGSLNVLQLIDVFNQHVDLTISRTETELQYLTANTRRFKLSALEIPLAARNGRHE